jgi:hypothetical protein
MFTLWTCGTTWGARDSMTDILIASQGKEQNQFVRLEYLSIMKKSWRNGEVMAVSRWTVNGRQSARAEVLWQITV